MESFKNEVIDWTSLPRYQETELRSIRPNYWKVIQFNFAIQFLIFATLIALFFILKKNLIHPFFWISISCFIVLMVMNYITLQIGFKKRSYGIRTHDLIYRTGVLSTKTTIIPFNRIQHVAVNEGFVSRYYSLAQLQIFTAGGTSSDMRISGLSKEEAEKIKEKILSKISDQQGEQAQSLTNE